MENEPYAGESLRTIEARRRAPTILIALALTNLVAYAMRNALFAVYPDLRARFDLHDAKLGLLTTIYLVPHAVATLPFGWAGDRFDRRRVIATGILLASVASALGGLATDAFTFSVSRAFVGLGTAAIVPVANSILGQLYEGPAKASRMAIFNLGLLFGGAAGFLAGGWLGFPGVVYALAVPGALLAILILALPAPRHPGQLAANRRSSNSGYFGALARGFYGDAKILLGIRTLRWLMVSTTAMAFAAGGYNAWLVDFLERDKGMAKQAATNLLVTTMFGAIAGILVGGRLADRLRRQRPNGRLLVILAGMTLTIPAAVAALQASPGIGLTVAGIATMFFISWYHAPMAVSVDDLAPPERIVAAQGLVIFTMHLIGTAPSSWVVGLVSEKTSLYTAMWVPTGALVIAALAMLVAIPTFAGDHARARSGTASAGRL
ncbi:MAG: MFS transporter [Deltaproteobacteria bacterium]|nr:MFS transporter [Deltaproteobacteria bacterium]